MRNIENSSELRSVIQRCKREELDTLIKFTNLPRKGLKKDIQLRLLSYLEQNPSSEFLSYLKNLNRRMQKDNGGCSTLVSSLPPCRRSTPEFALPSSLSSEDLMRISRNVLSQFNIDVSTNDNHRGNFNYHTDVSQSSTTLNSSSGAPSFANHCTSGGVIPHKELLAFSGTCVSSVSSSGTCESMPNTKKCTYFLPSTPTGPLLTLAGTDGCFRLPATLPDFRFRDSPFFKEIDVLLQPQILMPTHIGFATGRRSYDRSLVLRFTADQAETITYHCRRNPDERMEFGVQVIMRFTQLDPQFCNQLSEAYGLSTNRDSQRRSAIIGPKPIESSADSLPIHLSVQVNGHSAPLPPLLPSSRPGLDGRRNPRPINITQFLRVSPAMPNYIKVTWTHDYSSFVYALVGVYLVHKRSPQQLCSMLRSVAFRTPDSMKHELIQKLRPALKDQSSSAFSETSATFRSRELDTVEIIDHDNSSDDGDDIVMPNTLPVQLLCPLSKCRIEVPVRGRGCRHVQCYDATTYLIINERKPSWNCPVCDRKVRYEDLIIDGLFLEVLNSKCTQDIDEVVFHDDGSWSVDQKLVTSHTSDCNSPDTAPDTWESHSATCVSGSIETPPSQTFAGIPNTNISAVAASFTVSPSVSFAPCFSTAGLSSTLSHPPLRTTYSNFVRSAIQSNTAKDIWACNQHVGSLADQSVPAPFVTADFSQPDSYCIDLTCSDDEHGDGELFVQRNPTSAASLGEDPTIGASVDISHCHGISPRRRPSNPVPLTQTLIESAPVHRLPTGSYICSSPPVTSASHSRVSLSAFHAEDVQHSSRTSNAATLPAASTCNSVCEITDSESSPVDTHNGDEAPAIWCSSSKSRNYPHPSSFDYGVPRLPTNQIFLPTEPHSLPGFRPDPYHFYRYPPTNNALSFSPFHQLTNRDVLSNTADRYWMPRGSTPFAEPKITRRYERRCVKNPYYDHKGMDAFSYTHYMARRPCPPPPSHFVDTTRLNPLYSDLMNTSDHRIVLSNRNSNSGHEVLSNRSRDTRRGHFT